MTSELIIQGEQLIKKVESVDKFFGKYHVCPMKEVSSIHKSISDIIPQITPVENPTNFDEVISNEMKRRLCFEEFSLRTWLDSDYYNFQRVTQLYGIQQEELDSLRPWLTKNRSLILDEIERLYHSQEIKNTELKLHLDVPELKRQAEEFSALNIRKYHKVLGKLLERLTAIGGFLRDIDAVPTIDARSYFNLLTNTLAIGVPAICRFNSEGAIELNEMELIQLYGHEGMGHALNRVATKNSSLPYFLKSDCHLNTSSAESIAQFYQNVIFDVLKESPNAQKELNISHKFSEIYQDFLDVQMLNEYNNHLFWYALTVLADKSLGSLDDPSSIKKKIELLTDVALTPSFPQCFVENHLRKFDSQGNLDYKMASEIRYAAQPVKRVLSEFSNHGMNYAENRGLIDRTLLEGLWSPEGMMENAKRIIQNLD